MAMIRLNNERERLLLMETAISTVFRHANCVRPTV